MEEGKISEQEFILLMVGFVLGSSVVLIPGQAAGHDSWIAVFIGLIEGALFSLVYGYLGKRFEQKTLIEINDIVFGRIFGKVVSAFFLWYLFHLGTLVIGNFNDFFSNTSLPQTPKIIFAIFIVIVCIMAVKHGLEVVARSSQLLVMFAMGVFMLTILLSLNNFRVDNIKPVLEAPLGKILWAAHSAAVFPFAETVAFLMIIPFLNNYRRMQMNIIKAITVAGSMLAISAFFTSGVLGVTAGIFTYPTLELVGLIGIGHVLTRMDIIIIVGFLTMGFVKITILLYGTVLGSAQLLRFHSYKSLLLPISILMVLLSLFNFPSVSENIYFANWIYPIYALPFQVGIPVLTLIVAIIRRLPSSK